MKKKVSVLLLLWLAAFCLLPGVAGAALNDYNIEDTNEWQFYTLDDEEITQDTYADKVQLLVFYRSAGCSNSLATIRNLAASDWARDERVQIIAIEVSGQDKAAIQQFKNSNAADCGNMLLVYNDHYGYNNRIWTDYGLAVNMNSGSLAHNFVLADGKIRYAWSGNYSTANYQTAFGALLNETPGGGNQPGDDVAADGVYNFKISGNENYTEAYAVLAQLNAHRAANGRPALSMDEDLLAAAMQRAAECAVYYSHTRPDGSICTTIIPGNLYKAENIAIGYNSAAAVMNGWKNSAGHNANMLHDKMTSVGIGCFEYNGIKHWVQLFSSAAPQSVTPWEGSRASTHNILAAPQYLKLQAAPAAISLQPGETAVLRLNNTNLEYSHKTGAIQATYAQVDNESVAGVVLAGEQVQIKGLAAGVTKLKLGGAAANGTAAPYTLEVKITVAGDLETPGDKLKLTLNADQGYIDGTGQTFMLVEVLPGQAYRLPAASKSGYTLQYWSDGVNNYKANTDYAVAHDTELIAVWQKNSGGSGSRRPNNTQKPTQPEQPAKPAETTKPDGGLELAAAELDAAEVEVAAKYADVKQSDWYVRPVAYMHKLGLMNGLSEKEFAPSAETSRAMLVTMLYRLEGGQNNNAAAKFSDIAAGQWYSDAVNWAAAVGVVNGMADGKFAPNDHISREQLAAVLYRYAQLKGYDVSVRGDLTRFADGGNLPVWAQEPLAWAVGSGLMDGIGEGLLAPEQSANRAQVATMIMRFCEKYN